MAELNHIAFIMDGNSSWAKNSGKPQLDGYLEGMRNLSKIALECQRIGIKHATFYTFSTENWKRPKGWISSFMNLARKFFREDPSIEQLKIAGIKLRLLGNINTLDEDIQKILFDLRDQTQGNSGTEVCLAISYGGRDDIVRACQKILSDHGNITEDTITANLDTNGIPDPDIIIRTSGQKRLSNFLLWQLSYSELFFLDVFWPEFNEKDLQKVVEDFYKRNRKYGE